MPDLEEFIEPLEEDEPELAIAPAPKPEVDPEEEVAREAGLTLDELRELRASNRRLWPLGQ